MKFIRFYSILVLLCLVFSAQRAMAQCSFNLSVLYSDIYCFGEEGNIDLIVEGGTGPFSYSWSNGLLDEDISGLLAGTYTVTVTDGGGCSATLTQEIISPSEPLSLVLNSTGDVVTCQTPVNLIPDVSGGYPPYSFLWSTGATTDILPTGFGGTFTVTITDAGNCQITGEKFIDLDPAFPVADGGAPPLNEVYISCATAPNIIGGPLTSIGPDFRYEWTTFIGAIDPGVDPTQPFLEVTEWGTYFLTVTNIVQGCSTSSGPIHVFPIDPAFPVAAVQAPPALNCQTTQVTLNGAGSSTGPQYSYEWTTTNGHIVSGANTLNPVVDAVGIYLLAVTNTVEGCTKKNLVNVVKSPNSAVANAGPDTGIPCGGTQVNLDASGSASGPQFVYQWITPNGNIISGNNTLNPLVNQPGLYTLLVTDTQNGCTQTDDVTVFPGPAIPNAAFSVQDVSCTGQLGGIALTMSQGTAPYNYAWSNGSTEQNLININQGTYSVTVTDALSCNYYAEIIVKETPTITLNAQTTAPSCLVDNGTIDLAVTGLFGPFEYAWSNGASTQDISNLSPGTYTVTVTYAGATCTQTLSVTLSNNSGLVLSTVVTNAITCAGVNGLIDLTVTGGTAPYTYQWSDGETDQDADPQVVGTYTVTVVDALGCTAVTSAVVGDTPALSLSTLVFGDVCGANGGMIDLTVTGGVSPYTYAWSTGYLFQDLLNLTQGTYTVTVTDFAGCTKTVSGTILQSSGITVTLNPTDATCTGSNGSITSMVSGGNQPYTYLWSTGNTTVNLLGIPGGMYTVTVTSNSGNCIQTASVVVGQTSALVATAVPTDASCAGNDGAIALTVNGGTGPYTFLWGNAATDQNIGNLSVGTYTVTITDALTCTQTASATVGLNSSFTLSTTVDPVKCFGGSDGSIDLQVTGPGGPFTFSWAGGDISEDITNLVAGNYTCTVTDLGGCTQSISATVSQPSVITTSTVVTPVICFGEANGSIDLSVNGGTLGYTFLWNNGQTTEDMANLVAGTYTVTVMDSNGCTKTASGTITQPTTLNVSANVVSVKCFGSNDGAIALTITGGVQPYTINWSNGATTQTPFNLAAGTYCVTVSDVGNCTATACYQVIEPASIDFSITSLSNDCNTETLTGPNFPGIIYSWTGPNGFTSNAAVVNVGFSGTYSLTISDANNCFATDNYNVNLSGSGACGAIKGSVFHDEDESCTLEFGEPGLAGWIVRAEGLNDTLYGVTNSQGKYQLGVPVGTYTMKVLVPNGLWSVCPGGANVSVNMVGDTVSGGDFLVQAIYHCPALTVSIGTAQLRRCFLNNSYQVEYCNTGTEKATDAYITVVLDPLLTAMSVSVPFQDLGANALKVELGDLEIGECGMFSIQVYVSCNAQLGQTHCTQAFIYPDTLCAPTNSNWSGASLNVSSICNPDSLRFTIQNTGKAVMNSSSNYIVVEDGIMFRTGTIAPLAENESMQVSVPANGSTWRLEVAQEAFHPFPSPVGLSVEGCATSGPVSTGFVNQFSTPDEQPTVDVDCTTNIGSFDPNDKHGYPVGYGADHYVRPGTDIEYLIRFQNTGTDTAFTVQIIDTLSAWLDPATIRFGASSHPYRYDLNGEGIVHFIFDDILLPDSNTNEVASHGFAKFMILPRVDAPLETRIENTAAIYFDFNDPVVTNTTFHRLGENFITVGLWQPFVPEAQVIAIPNPFSEQTTLEVKGLVRSGGLRLQVLDLRGNLVQEMESGNEFFQLRKGDWPSGVYLFRITQNGRLVGTGKLMAE
jgi:uncharacterized repeat protein (TIGR01451 family)